MRVVGRDRELEAIEAFLDLEQTVARVLVLEGEAGIGKTTLWRTAVDRGRQRGYQVLACVGVKSQAQRSFTSLRDLIGDAFVEVAEELPAPQKRLLAGVLDREQASRPPPDPGAVAFAFLSLLRALADRAPTLLAVDDPQWLDPASAAPLGYVLRRLDFSGLRVLISRRTGADELRPVALDQLDTERLRIVEVGALAAGDLGHVLHDGLGLTHSRPTLSRLHEASGGNPFFALELARSLESSSTPIPAGAAIPVPPTLRELVDGHLTALPAETLEVLAFASALSRPTLAVVGAALSVDALPLLEPAVESDVADTDGERIRFAHPLFAAAAYGLATPRHRREMHGRLAAVVDDVEERARHLALSTDVPDRGVASAVEDAARWTRTGGDRLVCAQLFEAAARLTPEADASARARRMLGAAGAFFEAGDGERAQELLEPLVDELAEGSDRIEALWRLGTVLSETGREDRAMDLWEEALAAADDPAQIADIRRTMAVMTIYAGDAAKATEQADGAVLAAEASGDDERLAYALSARALAGAVAGDPSYRAFVDRALALEGSVETPCSAWSPRTIAGECARLALDVEEADRHFRVVLDGALETGNAEMEQWATYGLAFTELLRGNHRSARELTKVVLDLAEMTGVMRLPAARLEAEIDAHLGRTEEARSRLRDVMAEAEVHGVKRYLWQAQIALGLLELARGNATTAADELRVARGLAHSNAMRHAAIVSSFVDEVEAAALAGREAQAEEALAAARGSPAVPAWAKPLLLRANAALLASRGELPQAETDLAQALALRPPSELPLQRGRTLLALGSVQRRTRRRAAAREALQCALAIFEELDAAPWAEQARAELARIGGRQPSSGELTPSERRIAELVAEGKTNKEVATILVVAARTVESALTQIYRKLDVRSRTELARKLTGSD